MIGQRFSAAAATYDRHARPQQTLAQSLATLLPEMYPEQILELGAGTGQLTRRLIDRFPDVPIDAIDLAKQMVTQGRDQFRRFPHVAWHTGDAQTWRGTEPYPLVASSAALHWTRDFHATCTNIHANLTPDGRFALGMMLSGTLGELHALRREIAPTKPPRIVLPTYEETVATLHAAGFVLEHGLHSEERILYPDAPAFLRAIHEQGVTGGRIGTGSVPLARGEIARLMTAYQTRCATDGGVFATYETAALILRPA